MQSTMPDQLTNSKTPRDTRGELLQDGRIYMVSQRGSSFGVRMKVFEADGVLCAQSCSRQGNPNIGSRPQRIDEMDSAVTWEAVG